MKKKINVRDMVVVALMLAIGLVAHQLTPSFFGMEADLTLIMLGSVISLFNDNLRLCGISGVVLGIFTAITTKFPGGQIPNIIDKIVTAFVITYLYKYISKINNQLIRNILLFSSTTIISGLVFLGSAFILVGLPSSFYILATTSVLPAVIANTIVGIIIQPLIKTIYKYGIV